MSYTRKELEAAGLTDFRVFLRQVWDFLRLPPPTDVQNDIAYTLQHGDTKHIISAFRGVGKSWITVAFVVWNLLLNPECKILVVSANKERADEFSKFCKQIIHGMPLLQHLAPRVDQRNSAISFDVGPARPSGSPSVKSAGIGGQITGSRADIIIADDIEIPKNSYTHLLRERLSELVKEFTAILKPLPASRIIYLGTPQNEQSLYNRLVARGYTMTVWPAEIPEDVEKYQGRLGRHVTRLIRAGAKAGDPVDPVRFSTAVLENGPKIEYGRTGYALQFMLDTSPSDADRYPLKLRDLLIADVDSVLGWVKLVWSGERQYAINDLPTAGLDNDYLARPAYRSDEMAGFTGKVMAVDPSGQGRDETAYAIVYALHGVLYLVEVGGFRDGYSEATLAGLAAAAVRHQVNTVVVERNFGGGTFTALLKGVLSKVPVDKDGKPTSSRPLHNCTIEEVYHTGMKEARLLDTLEPLFQAHKLVVDRKVIEADAKVNADTPNYSLVYQMTRLARLKGCLAHDDRVEAVYMACAHFIGRLGRDDDKALRQHKQAAFDAELQKYMQAAVTISGRVLPKKDRRAASKRRW